MKAVFILRVGVDLPFDKSNPMLPVAYDKLAHHFAAAIVAAADVVRDEGGPDSTTMTLHVNDMEVSPDSLRSALGLPVTMPAGTSVH